jgi:hypothetical protein
MEKTVVKNGISFTLKEVTINIGLELLSLYKEVTEQEGLTTDNIELILQSAPSMLGQLIIISPDQKITDLSDVSYSMLESLLLDLAEVNASFLARTKSLVATQGKELGI